MDNFGRYADLVQGATVTFLKTAPSTQRWEVSQLQLKRTFLQVGIDGGAGVTHGITDPNLTTLIMQLTDFDDRVSLDGAPCESCMLVILPPECHFTFVRTGSVKWFSWSIPRDEDIATRIVPGTVTPRSLKTEKFMIPLPDEAASRFRRVAHETLGGGGASTPAETHVEDMLRDQLEEAWGRNTAVDLPSDFTRPAEQIVFRALQFAQSRRGQIVEIGDLAKAGAIGYRTMLRAFERYLKLSPKRYLKLRQINDAYHAIRRRREEPLADILSGCGVNEFGRFAGEYRSVFGELPSITYQRYRPPAEPSGPLLRA